MTEPTTLEEALQIISDRDKEILRLRNWLLDISFYSFDYDGYNSSDKLKMVIDNVNSMIKQALDSEPNSEAILAVVNTEANNV